MFKARPSSATLSAQSGILLVSPTHRDSLAAQLVAMGYSVTAIRHVDTIEDYIKRIKPAVLLIDSRDALDEAHAALAILQTTHLKSCMIYTKGQDDLLEQCVAAGVGSVCADPFSNAELSAAIRMALRDYASPNAASLPAYDHDTLTGLPKNVHLRQWIAEVLGHIPVTLIMMRISAFDVVNDAFGREKGDMALRALAHRMQPIVSEVGDQDALLARLQGTEFVIAVRGDYSIERLHLLSEALVEVVMRPFSVDEELVRLSCAVAIVSSTQDDKNAAQFLKRATATLAEHDLKKTSSIHVMSSEKGKSDILSRTLHADLRAALEQDQIEVLYQPQVGIGTGRIEGVEALARWNHPEHGKIGAATLFAVAEQSDYMLQLSNYIQRLAVDQAAQWPQSLSHLRLAVNVTAGDISRPRFAKMFLKLIDHSGFPKERLTVEVTETGLMADLESASRILGQLRIAGCRVAIDDFGTGYSSLAYLNALPADYLKIDKGLATDILGSDRAQLVVRGVITMARSLGLSVIAEGVEDENHLAILAREGCSLYQGFLCAPALSSKDLEQLILEQV
jgi:diguanylate cyclase (GGDEF)-like protein